MHASRRPPRRRRGPVRLRPLGADCTPRALRSECRLRRRRRDSGGINAQRVGIATHSNEKGAAQVRMRSSIHHGPAAKNEREGLFKERG